MRVSRLRSFGDFGSLPDETAFIPLKDPGHEPNDRGEAIMGINRGWGQIDGLAPGNTRVPNFKARYAYAKKISKQAEEDYKVTSPIRKLCRKFDDALGDALSRVYSNYIWDKGCWFGKDPEGATWDNCRTDDQVSRLKSALEDVNTALNQYAQIEAAMSKAPCPSSTECTDYMPPDPVGSGGGSPTTVQPQPTIIVEKAEKAERGTVAATYQRSVIDEEETPLWKKLLMYGAPGVIALGVVGALFLKKKPRSSVAGYRRRRRR